MGGFALHYFAFCQHSFWVLVRFVQLVCRHWVNWTHRGLGPFLKIDGLVKSSLSRQHLTFCLFKTLLILSVLFWQCLQLYSPFFFSFNPSHLLAFFIVRHSFIQLKEIRHCRVSYISVARGFFENTFCWVPNILKGVFIIPPPKRYDQIIFSCVRNFARYHTSVTVGTDFQSNRVGMKCSSGRRSFAIECCDF